MSNFLKRAHDRLEAEIESDKYTLPQRLAAASLVGAVIIGGVSEAAEHELDERIIDGIGSIVGYDSEINHYDG